MSKIVLGTNVIQLLFLPSLPSASRGLDGPVVSDLNL